MQTFLNNSNSRGLRNNNPGNMRRLPKKDGKDQLWQAEIPYSDSKDASFSQFREVAWGIRAFYKNAVNSFKKGNNTLAKFIAVYAPASENDTNAYISTVANAMGISKDTVLLPSQTTLTNLAKAMFKVELGSDYANQLTEQNYSDAWAFYSSEYGSGELPGLTINSDQRCKFCGHMLAIIGLFFFTYFTVTT